LQTFKKSAAPADDVTDGPTTQLSTGNSGKMAYKKLPIAAICHY
jgi:hypothetical protein